MLADDIEAYLLERRTWVSSYEICARFNVTERQLRQVGAEQGLCSRFAISSDKGFKHVSLASSPEWIRFKHRLRKHGIAELVRVRDLGRVRRDAYRLYRARKFEKDSGQALMLGLTKEEVA